MICHLLFSLLVLVARGQTDLRAFNETFHGKLRLAKPISSPCFDGDKEECAAVQAEYRDPSFRVEQYSAFMYPSWETCLATGEGCVLNFASPNDSTAWTGGRTCQQGSISPVYIEVENVEDVRIAFTVASQYGISLSIKNTGHDFLGRSTLKGSLALWMHKLDRMSYNPETVIEGGSETYPAITLGAGALWNDVYRFADTHNITVIGGYATTVGASGGWLMGGGHSVLSPVFGLGVDRVLQFKIVTPDGHLRVANKHQNTDLFWALRGGGGGTFGVVMESTMLVEPQMKLQVASISFDGTEQNVLEFLRIVVDSSLQWGHDGWGGHIVRNGLISVTPLLTLDGAKRSMESAIDYAISQNGTAIIEELPSWYSFFQNYVLAAQAAIGGHTALASRLIPSNIFTTESSKAALLDALVESAAPRLTIISTTPFLYDRAENNGTSITPAWRDALWHTSFGINLPWNATQEQIQQGLNTIDTSIQPLRDLAPDSGAYQSETFIYEPDHERQFWGHNYARLLEVKQKYDEKGVLDCWHCVGSRGVDDERFLCYPSYP